jgi:hypothetical protein
LNLLEFQKDTVFQENHNSIKSLEKVDKMKNYLVVNHSFVHNFIQGAVEAIQMNQKDSYKSSPFAREIQKEAIQNFALISSLSQNAIEEFRNPILKTFQRILKVFEEDAQKIGIVKQLIIHNQIMKQNTNEIRKDYFANMKIFTWEAALRFKPLKIQEMAQKMKEDTSYYLYHWIMNMLKQADREFEEYEEEDEDDVIPEQEVKIKQLRKDHMTVRKLLEDLKSKHLERLTVVNLMEDDEVKEKWTRKHGLIRRIF